MEKVIKPWGYEIIFAKTHVYVGKILHIEAGHKLSLQYHEIKMETIYLQSGLLEFVVEKNGVYQKILMRPGESEHISPGVKHRMIAIETCDVFEVSTPELNDVIRLEDHYGRA